MNTYPELSDYPLALVLEDPPISIRLIGLEGVVVKGRGHHFSTLNLHHPRPVKLAQKAKNPIRQPSVTTWSHDIPVPARKIHTN